MPPNTPTAIPIGADQIAQLCELARLRMPPEQQEALRGKLQELVKAFSALAEADLGEIAGAVRTSNPQDLRRDVADESVPTTEQVLANAPRTAADSFVVPRVLDA